MDVTRENKLLKIEIEKHKSTISILEKHIYELLSEKPTVSESCEKTVITSEKKVTVSEPIDKNYCEGKIMEVIDGKSYHGNCKYNQRNWFTKTYPGIYHIFHEYNEDHHMKRKFPGIYDTKDASIFCNNCILDEGLSKHRRACRVYRCLGH